MRNQWCQENDYGTYAKKKSLLPSTFALTTEFIKPVKCARQRYHIDLEQQKKKVKSDACNQQLEIVKAETKDLTQRKQLLVDPCKKLDNEFIQVIKEAEEKNDMKLVINGNALKRKSKKKKIVKSVLWKNQSKFSKRNEERLCEK